MSLLGAPKSVLGALFLRQDASHGQRLFGVISPGQGSLRYHAMRCLWQGEHYVHELQYN
jgi:hypothetical protein